MALKRLPNDVQSLLSASVQVNSYKTAIEELIYNSLDAKSTSIAIRINIQESTIQVIDNGDGIIKNDFYVIGQRYMTSKVTNVATLKAAPKNYGYRGEFLANIITVSQMVKVTSRHESTEETWAKTFINGKDKRFAQMTTRPTKGTTVDIKGFLYNLNIQKKGINSINELQNIKLFLEHLSLVHNHLSLSLRDDSQNEIVFKIHKKRDIYQTLSTLFNIGKVDVIELQVEKHDYKVKGFIRKSGNELDLHWIFLNGKFIQDCSKLHTILNEYFKKSLNIKDQSTLKSKKNNDENHLFNQNIPYYFIFITCPYIDYDDTHISKQSVLQFKNWEQINKLLEKLAKFYAGDDNLIEMKKVEDKRMNKELVNTKVNYDTRDQVKKIMDKILGSNSKKLGVSQLQNGIKGKMVKRKVKKKKHRSPIIPKPFLQNDKRYNNDDNATAKSKYELIPEHNIEQQTIQRPVDDLEKNREHNTPVNSRNHKQRIKIPGSKKCKTKKTPMHKNKKKLKANILIPTKKKNKYKTTMKQKHTLNELKKVNVNNEIKSIEGIDSVCKRSKIVAQKVEEFFRHTKKRNANANQSKNVFKKDNQNTMFMQKNYCAIDNNISPQITNKYFIEKYIMNKIKTKSYKTTYDLVQTVLESQQDLLNAATMESNMSEELYRKFQRRNGTLRCVTRAPKQYTWTNKYICSEYSNNDGKQEKVSHYTTDIAVQYKTCSEYEDNFNEYLRMNVQKEICDNMMTNVSERLNFIDKDNNIYTQNQNSFCSQKETFNRTLSGPLRTLTYDSHQCHKNAVYLRNNTENYHTMNRQKNVRLITKEVRDNSVTSYGFRNRFIKPFETVPSKQTFDIRMKQTIDESYTIEYSKSNTNNYHKAHNNVLPNNEDLILENDYNKHDTVSYEPVSPINYQNPVLGNTYTIHPSNFSFEENVTAQNKMKISQNIQSTGPLKTYSLHDSHSEVNNDNNGSKTTEDNLTLNSKNYNIVFVSKSQRSETVPSDNNMIIEPLNVCETVFYEIGSDEKEFAVSFNEHIQLNDSLYGNIKDSIDEHVENEHVLRTEGNDDVTENVSHHFSCAVKAKQSQLIDNIIDDNLQDPKERNQNGIINRDIKPSDLPVLNNEGNFDAEHNDYNFNINFNLKSRPRFVPKGMSQIFENCHTKTVCDYDMDKDYFEDNIYNNFANDVQVNSEIYEPIVQNVEDLTTKNIHNFQNKVKKDNASLVFDETSLKNAKVLGQADCKFIVAIMKKRCGQSKKASEYLLLFDQHAVHERIRLEKNFADYLNEERWTSVAVDNIILKMSKDEVLYLHNYKDKFTQLGLQWNILNDNEVTVHSIPEAILGKNPREVEKVIKAVRNLVVEEINVIKLQKGCVSLYPKSIMDLVFSESCRYAIKFGDQLSKRNCVELLNALSNCKTPFQCAHGRPVMAVITDVIADKREYKINMDALRRFRQRNARRTLK